MLVTWLPSTSLISNSSAIYFLICESDFKLIAYIVAPNNTPGFGIDVWIVEKGSNCFANPFSRLSLFKTFLRIRDEL